MENHQDEEIEIHHRELIQEEDIDISALPPELRNAIRKFDAKLEEYEETGDYDLSLELQQDDVAIADDITTWLEDNESDDDDDDEDDGYMNDDDDDDDESTPSAQPQAQNKSVSDIEQKVRAAIKNNVISVDELETIIGTEPDYPTQRVGSLILTKQYLKPFYQVG